MWSLRQSSCKHTIPNVCCGSNRVGSTLHRVRDTRNVLSPSCGDLPVGRLLDWAVESFFRIFRNISVPTYPKSILEFLPSHPPRAAYHDRRGRGVGCGGRGSVLRATGLQGGLA